MDHKFSTHKDDTLLPLMNQDMLAAGNESGHMHEILTTSPGL